MGHGFIRLVIITAAPVCVPGQQTGRDMAGSRTGQEQPAQRKPRSGIGRTMWAARLHGPSDLRVERVPHPGHPRPGEVLLKVRATGLCGSDLHSFLDGRIGDTVVESPLVLGHEFGAVIHAVGAGARDARHQPLGPGVRVAVDPAQPCGRCEQCEQGHPNLCPEVAFCGNHPYGGSLCEWIRMPGRCCFPVPDTLDDEAMAWLEPLGVALHTVDLAHLRVGHSVAVLGAGPIGLLILQLARRAGADPVYVADPLPWRRKWAERLGGVPVGGGGSEPVSEVAQSTGGRGVDVAIEAAWADSSVAQAADMTRPGGRLVVVGIASDDRLSLRASVARRKGLTLAFCRRMKHVYPRAIRLATGGGIVLRQLVSHRYPLAQAAAAFALNAAYEDRVMKVMIHTDMSRPADGAVGQAAGRRSARPGRTRTLKNGL
jgi:L-iditol 2-dehydrogenase